MNSSKIVSIKPLPTGGERESAPAAGHPQSAVEFRELMRLLGGNQLIDDASMPVVFTAESELIVRRVTARYGFERLPATYGELFGLFEYCDSLDAASGVGIRPKEELKDWQAASFEVWRRKQPELMPAIERFCAGEIEALLELHRSTDALTRLGLNYLGLRSD
jgi:hypothetical protein